MLCQIYQCKIVSVQYQNHRNERNERSMRVIWCVAIKAVSCHVSILSRYRTHAFFVVSSDSRINLHLEVQPRSFPTLSPQQHTLKSLRFYRHIALKGTIDIRLQYSLVRKSSRLFQLSLFFLILITGTRKTLHGKPRGVN